MRFSLYLIATSLAAGPAFASVQQPEPYEEVSRALQQAKRVAITENGIESPARALLLSQRVVQNVKTIAYAEPEATVKSVAPKRAKKAAKNQPSTL